MILYVDASAGVSGDMLLAGFLDLGLPISALQGTLRSLTGVPVRFRIDRVQRGSERALSLRWRSPAVPPPSFPDPHRMIQCVERSSTPQGMKEQVIDVLRLLTKAEAMAHGAPLHRVRFVQLGGLDTLVNLFGCALALRYWKIQAVYVSPIPIGRRHEGHHGAVLRSVGPATVRLLRALPVEFRKDPFEWTTPTAAALLARFASAGLPPPLKVEAIGRAVGQRTPPRGSGVLRLLLARRIF